MLSLPDFMNSSRIRHRRCEMRKAHKILVGISEVNRLLQRPGYKLEDEVKTHLQEMSMAAWHVVALFC